MFNLFGLRAQVSLPRLILAVSLIISAISLIAGVNQVAPTQATKLDPPPLGHPSTPTELVKAGRVVPTAPPETSHLPSRIVIPLLKIDLPIQPAAVVDGYWQVPIHTAAFGLGSSLPRDLGNTVVFAHSQSDLFAPLKKIQPGFRVYLLTPARLFVYSVASIQEVNPSEVSVVSDSPHPQLTLYTCSGPSDSKRLVVVAKPLEN